MSQYSLRIKKRIYGKHSEQALTCGKQSLSIWQLPFAVYPLIDFGFKNNVDHFHKLWQNTDVLSSQVCNPQCFSLVFKLIVNMYISSAFQDNHVFLYV